MLGFWTTATDAQDFFYSRSLTYHHELASQQNQLKIVVVSDGNSD